MRLLRVEMVPDGKPTHRVNAWGRGGTAAQGVFANCNVTRNATTAFESEACLRRTRYTGEMPLTSHALPKKVSHVVMARTWAWVPPHEARALAARIDDAVLAGKDGSFIFELHDNTRKGGMSSTHVMYCMATRRLLNDPPHVQQVRMPKQYVQKFACEYIDGKKSQPLVKIKDDKCTDETAPGGEVPLRMLILLGGSGAGKSTLLRFFESMGVDIVREWVLSGLDEFLEYVPEYLLATCDPTIGYRTGADNCYRDAIAIARAVNTLCAERRIHLIIEDTGKEIARTIGFIEQGMREGRDVTIALVDNDPETAVTRALGRFQLTGRFASAEYVRSSFRDVFENYCILKRRANIGEINVSTFVYVDNSGDSETNYWLDCRPEFPGVVRPPPILPQSAFCQKPMMYRAHQSVLAHVLAIDPRVREAYQGFDINDLLSAQQQQETKRRKKTEQQVMSQAKRMSIAGQFTPRN